MNLTSVYCKPYLYGLLASVISLSVMANSDKGEGVYGLSIEQLLQLEVSAVSKRPQAIEDAPGIVSVITRSDIQRYGANNLLEVLQRFPGFIPVSDITFGPRGAALRGDTNVTGEHILTLVDGKPFRSSINAIHTTRNLYQAFPLQAIERIELIRGPGSAIYGTNAMTGVINIITRKESHSYVEVGLKAGTFNTQQQSLQSNYAKGSDLQMSLTLDASKSDGWSSDIESVHAVPDPGVRHAYDKPTKHQTLLGRLQYKGFSVQTLLMDYDSNFVQPLEIPQGIYENIITSENRYIDMDYTHDFNQDWQITGHIAHHRATDSQFEAEEENNLLGADIKAQLTPAGLKLVAGFELRDSDFSANSDQVSGFDNSLTQTSLFAQFDIPLHDDLNAHVGAQYNRIKDGDEDVSPRLGLVYKYAHGQGLKLLYNKAFRSPKAAETDLEISLKAIPLVVFVGKEDLNSETVKTIDFQWFSYQEYYHVTANLFVSEYDNRIELDPSVFPISYKQQSSVEIYGLELEGRILFGFNGAIDWYYTHQENEGDDKAKDTTLAPNDTFGFGFSQQFSNDINIGLFNQYVSAFEENPVAVVNNPKPQSYNLLSAKLSLPIKKLSGFASLEKATLSFYANNLLDEEIWQTEIISANFNSFQVTGGRAFYVNLQLNW